MTINTLQRRRQSLFPDLPRGIPVIDPSGKFTDNWHLGLSTLFQQLQKNFSNEGIQIPQLTSNPNNDQFGAIQAIYNPALINKTLGQTPNISGQLAYDTYTSSVKVFIITFATPDDSSSAVQTASWKTFTLT